MEQGVSQRPLGHQEELPLLPRTAKEPSPGSGSWGWGRFPRCGARMEGGARQDCKRVPTPSSAPSLFCTTHPQLAATSSSTPAPSPLCSCLLGLELLKSGGIPVPSWEASLWGPTLHQPLPGPTHPTALPPSGPCSHSPPDPDLKRICESPGKPGPSLIPSPSPALFHQFQNGSPGAIPGPPPPGLPCSVPSWPPRHPLAGMATPLRTLVAPPHQYLPSAHPPCPHPRGLSAQCSHAWVFRKWLPTAVKLHPPTALVAPNTRTLHSLPSGPTYPGTPQAVRGHSLC